MKGYLGEQGRRKWGLTASKLCGTACPEQSTIKIAVDFIIII